MLSSGASSLAWSRTHVTWKGESSHAKFGALVGSARSIIYSQCCEEDGIGLNHRRRRKCWRVCTSHSIWIDSLWRNWRRQRVKFCAIAGTGGKWNLFVSCFTLVSLLRCSNWVFSNCSRASARIPVAESKAERLLDVPARTRAKSAVQTALAAQSSYSARVADSKASRRKTRRGCQLMPWQAQRWYCKVYRRNKGIFRDNVDLSLDFYLQFEIYSALRQWRNLNKDSTL